MKKYNILKTTLKICFKPVDFKKFLQKEIYLGRW